MVLIYSHTTSPRLQYVCNFIFKELLGVDFRITIDSEEFKIFDGTKINYSNIKICDNEFRIENVDLLFEEGIKKQHIQCFTIKGYKAFFKIDDCNCVFDIFAATFYLLSRYEEYLPHTKDIYGRYGYENSLAFKENFLQLPLINIWVNDFAESLKNKFSAFNFQLSPFNFIPTYDIDIAFSYKHKGVVRNIGGFIKQPSLERIKVLLGLQPDPFDTYNWLHQLHEQHNLKPIYFFLLAEKNSQYDKNILLHKNALWRLIKLHNKKYTVGIHPSWQSGDTPSLIKKEIGYLQAMKQLDKTIEPDENEKILSRQHYIRFNLPEGYRRLIDAGVTDDYSMGYGSINGFRASVANSFFWFDVEKNEATNLRIHPFCFMEANSFYEQKFTANEAFDELMHYYNICKKVNGTLITVWHNDSVGTSKEFIGWGEMYEKFIVQVYMGCKDAI